MDKIETLETKKYYIVSLDNGIREEEPVTMDILNQFSDGSSLVQLNNTIFGLFKSNSLNPESEHIDDYEIIKSDIAELLDVDHEESRRIVDEEKNVGIFTNLNYRKDIETRISATAMFNQIISLINKGNSTNEKLINISKLLRNPQSTKETPVKDQSIIKKIVEEGIDVLTIGIANQSQSALDPNQILTIRKNYIRMILFDMIIDRKNRGFDYHIICPLDENKKINFDKARFSPISILSNPVKENAVPVNSYCINNEYINREALIDTLYSSFYPELKKVVTSLNDAARLYKDAISRIIYNNIDMKYATDLENNIIDNYDNITKRQQEVEQKEDLLYKENKVERTMATQSLNVRVTAKLDLIQKKYPINPKNAVEEPTKDNQDKKLKLIVENENEAKAGFASAAVLVSIVGLICGIVTGVTYILLIAGR